ncbi:MAG TPA: heat-inducible transcriptional repressor HrcA [Myxococcota bacterium]
MTEPALSDREGQVLLALVDAHIASGEPIGSKVLADHAGLSVSPQTVRNVLSALSERGLISQPHTSAGRVPTDLGLRYYVDSLVRFSPPAPQVQGEIATRLEDAGGVDHALREASRVLSRLSQKTCVVLAPPPASDRVARIELLRLRDEAILFIAVSVEGRVQNRLLEWRHGPAPSAAVLSSMSTRLSEMLAGTTLQEGQQLLAARLQETQSALDAVEAELLRLSQRGVAAFLPDPAVHVDGTSHLIGDVDDNDARRRQKELISLLDEQQRVRELLDGIAVAPGVRVFIGAENGDSALSSAGVVAATVGSGKAIGVLGVIGPRHLDYGRVVPLVDATAAILSRLMG